MPGEKSLFLDACDIQQSILDFSSSLNIKRMVIKTPVKGTHISNFVRILNPKCLEFLNMSSGTCPLFIETAVLGCSRIEYLRITVSHLTIRSNYFEQLKLSIHVMLHF